MIRHALAEAWPWLALIGIGVAAVVLFGRDPKADEHDLTDYQPAPVPINTAPRSLARYEALDLQSIHPVDILPPAPPGMNAGSPLYAEMLFESWRRETPAAAAARFLREIGDSERAKAGIRPASEHWASLDGSCWDDCPGCARDYTGAFPVVAVA